jgi:[ribosomal protein S5]-alanine N-acetyltransferase
LYRFIPQGPPDSLRALESRYSMLSSRRSPDGREAWLNFALRLRQSARNAPTYVGTLQATVLLDRVAYIAYTMFVPFQRQGYAMEGCVRLIEHLIGDYRTRVVVAEMDTRNVASIVLAEALGFERVGTTIEADHFKCSVSDEHRYELSVRE